MTSFICTQCGNSFIRQAGRVGLNANVFCTKSCAATFNNHKFPKRSKQPKMCKSCGVQFIPENHANRCLDCCKKKPPRIRNHDKDYYSSWHVAHKKPCPDCGSMISAKSMKCRSCSHKDSIKNKGLTIKSITDLVASKKRHPSWKSSLICAFNRTWNSDLQKQPCGVCGYSTHVELCHIRSVSSFPETATLGEVNSRTNNIPLCRNHHWELDHGKLSEESALKIELYKQKQ